MEHESFLRAIIARPDDDLPRLIYADFAILSGRCRMGYANSIPI